MSDTRRPDRAAGYAQALHALAGVLVDRTSLRGTLDHLLQVAVVATPHVDALTVTAIDDAGSYTTAAWTTDAARDVDEREYVLDEGPCIEALHTGAEQLVTDTATDGRWPAFDEVARDAGFRTVAGLPLATPGGEVVGALNVFVAAVDGLTEDDLRLLRRVAVPAGAVLANARAYRRTAAMGDELEATLEERAIWHRAVGIVLGRHGGDPAEAVEVLHRTAEAEAMSVNDLAAKLVAGATVRLRRG